MRATVSASQRGHAGIDRDSVGSASTGRPPQPRRVPWTSTRLTRQGPHQVMSITQLRAHPPRMLVVFGTPVAFATTGLVHLVAWPSGSEIETSTRLRDHATLWTVVQALRHQASMAPSQSYGLMTLSRPGFIGGYDALASRLIIVWSCPISQSFSYSAGGIFPQAEWSLSLLYQDTHSAVATVTSPSSCHGPSRLISSFLYREFTASAAALS